jgi:uncharacterized membrane protein (DUF2068 family)
MTTRTPTSNHADRHMLGLRTVAAFEAAKGLIVLAAGSGLLLLVHRDVQVYAERLVAHLHLDPASRYPRIFIRAAANASPLYLRLLALGAFVYSTLRFVEAVGLWRARRWAEWLGVGTGVIYMPFEALALVRHPGLEPLGALLANVAIVLYLGLRLHAGSRARDAAERSARGA